MFRSSLLAIALIGAIAFPLQAQARPTYRTSVHSKVRTKAIPPSFVVSNPNLTYIPFDSPSEFNGEIRFKRWRKLPDSFNSAGHDDFGFTPTEYRQHYDSLTNSIQTKPSPKPKVIAKGKWKLKPLSKTRITAKSAPISRPRVEVEPSLPIPLPTPPPKPTTRSKLPPPPVVVSQSQMAQLGLDRAISGRLVRPDSPFTTRLRHAVRLLQNNGISEASSLSGIRLDVLQKLVLMGQSETNYEKKAFSDTPKESSEETTTPAQNQYHSSRSKRIRFVVGSPE
jgi:hypothetical protein